MTLEERRINLLRQIEFLKMETLNLSPEEDRETALWLVTGTVRYTGPVPSPYICKN